MSTYAISDIHGCYDELMEVLSLASFNDEKDVLYILGDIIDRGPASGDAVRWMLPRLGKSVRFIIGNHESMLAGDIGFYQYPVAGDGNGWMFQSSDGKHEPGNYIADDELSAFLDAIGSAPAIEQVEVGGEKYILAHAGLRPPGPYGEYSDWFSQDKMALLRIREEWFCSEEEPPGTCIFGHTPIHSIYRSWIEYGMAGYDEAQAWDGHCLRWGRRIAIDGGCCFGRHLILLRLDDLKDFSVPSHRIR